MTLQSIDFEPKSAEELLRWSMDQYGLEAGLASSFGMEDMVLIDMIAKLGGPITIFTLDTGRLHEETYEVIERVRKNRKMVGGGMRQAGILAAAGIVALDSMVDRLADDHTNARRLAQGLAVMPGISLDPDSIQTNLVIFEVTNRPATELIDALKEHGLLVSYADGQRVRMVTHYGIGEEDIDDALNIAESVAREGSRAAG